MATNPFFSSNRLATQKDQKLVESIITEMIQAMGVDVIYLPRNLVDYDQIYGESDSSYFDDFYTIEMYPKNIEGYGGDKEYLSKFGIQIEDEITLSVSKSRFLQEVVSQEPGMSRPREGDLIAIPDTIDKRKRLFEISSVNAEEVFYQLGKLYTWELKCRAFSFAGEEFDTGVDSIDSYNDEFINLELKMGSGNGLDFIAGEQLSVVGTPITAKAVAWNATTKTLVIENMFGDFGEEQRVAGTQSGALWKVLTLSKRIANTNTKSDTDKLNLESQSIVLFDETNPFSE